MKSLALSRDQYLELEKISIGAFYPLTGFMGKEELNSVVDKMRLLDGSIFPLPVLLDISSDDYQKIKRLNKVELLYENEVIGQLYPNEFFECNRVEIAKKIYGTSSVKHPGVAYFYGLHPIFVGGRVEMNKRPSLEFSDFEFTPAETRKYFSESNWIKIVGFQTRNAPHRAHEYLLRVALEISDGLFIQPLVGHKKSGDFTPEGVLVGYEALIEHYLPKNRIFLGTLSTLMRYAGPREAVFHAIVRRNYGCTHFIVGRDHAGVGDWYGLYDAHKLISRFDGELGIEILKLKGPYYCKKCESISTESSCPHSETEYIEHISGTYVRKLLQSGVVLDRRFMRDEVLGALSTINPFIN